MAHRTDKPVRLSAHARLQLDFRGVREAEVVDAIRSRDWQSAELGRLECQHDLAFGDVWHGVYYENKWVRPIFVDDPGEIVVVTVYVYFF